MMLTEPAVAHDRDGKDRWDSGVASYVTMGYWEPD